MVRAQWLALEGSPVFPVLIARHNLRSKTKTPVGGARGQFHHEIKQELQESKEKQKEEQKERERHEKKLQKLTLHGLSEEEMIAYAMMLSQEESTASSAASESSIRTSQPSDTMYDQEHGFTPDDFVDDDEDLMKAVLASLDEMSAEDTSQARSCGTEETLSTDSEEWPTAADGNGGYRNHVNPTAHLNNNPWADAKARVIEPLKADYQQSNINRVVHEEEYDEELEYVLRLSRGEF